MTTASAPVAELPKPKWGSLLQAPKQVGDPKSIFVYGTHGTGKSTFAGSIVLTPGFEEKCLFVDIDNGAETLASHPGILKAINEGRLDILPINSLAGNAFGQINTVIEDITRNDYGYKAVIFDTLDVAQDVAEKTFKEKYKDSKNTFGVFGDLGAWTDWAVRSLHNAPHFVSIVTAHSKEQTAESGAYRNTPRLSGSSKDAIGGIPSIVTFMEYATDPEGNRRRLFTLGEHEHYITKNRYSLPNQMADLTMPKLYEAIRKNRNQASAVPAAA